MIELWKKYKAHFFLALLALVFVYGGYIYYYKYFYLFKDPKVVKDVIMSYGHYSLVAFMFLQLIQVIIFFIPGEVVQITGGYIYGTFFGGVLSLIGITAGSLCVYGIARVLGKQFVQKIVGRSKRRYLERILDLGSKEFVVFLIYLIPGIPKDVVGYICGVSKISLKDFLLYSTLGRVPGIFISAYFGSIIMEGKKAQLIAISVVMTILFVIGVYKGERIIKGLTVKPDESRQEKKTDELKEQKEKKKIEVIKEQE